MTLKWSKSQCSGLSGINTEVQKGGGGGQTGTLPLKETLDVVMYMYRPVSLPGTLHADMNLPPQ